MGVSGVLGISADRRKRGLRLVVGGAKNLSVYRQLAVVDEGLEADRGQSSEEHKIPTNN